MLSGRLHLDTSQAWALAGTGFQVANLFELFERLFYRPFQLGITPLNVVLGGDIDLDIGIGAVVFNAPANIFEPERALRFGNHGAIDKLVIAHIANHTAPGAL